MNVGGILDENCAMKREIKSYKTSEQSHKTATMSDCKVDQKIYIK